MTYLPHLEARALIEGDLDPVIPSAAREAMLDLILAWADLDGSVAFLAAATSGLDPSQGAEKFGRKMIADKLKAAAKALKASGHDSDAARVQKIATNIPIGQSCESAWLIRAALAFVGPIPAA